MKSETILEVVSKLVGYIEPYGDTGIDKIRYENQEKLIDLVTNGIEDLIENSKHRHRTERSIEEIGTRAYESLKELYQMIGCAMRIYESNQVKSIRQIQCYEDTERVWQYYNKFENPCECGSNCYHFEYDRDDDKIYGVCNCCNKDIYVMRKECKDDKLKQGKWVDKDDAFYG